MLQGGDEVQVHVESVLAEAGATLDALAWREGDLSRSDAEATERAMAYLLRGLPRRAMLVLAGRAGYALRFVVPDGSLPDGPPRRRRIF